MLKCGGRGETWSGHIHYPNSGTCTYLILDIMHLPIPTLPIGRWVQRYQKKRYMCMYMCKYFIKLLMHTQNSRGRAQKMKRKEVFAILLFLILSLSLIQAQRARALTRSPAAGILCIAWFYHTARGSFLLPFLLSSSSFHIPHLTLP